MLDFTSWTDLVDAYLTDLVGLSSSDLPDGPSWDCWNSGYDPEEYADELLESEGYHV